MLNHRVLHAPLERENASCLHCAAHQQVRLAPMYTHVTQHFTPAKRTSRESEIVLRGCWLTFLLENDVCVPLFLHYKLPHALNPLSHQSDCAAAGECFIFHTSVPIQESTPFPSSVFVFIPWCQCPQQPSPPFPVA